MSGKQNAFSPRHAPPPVSWPGKSGSPAQAKHASPGQGQRPGLAPPPVHWPGGRAPGAPVPVQCKPAIRATATATMALAPPPPPIRFHATCMVATTGVAQPSRKRKDPPKKAPKKRKSIFGRPDTDDENSDADDEGSDEEYVDASAKRRKTRPATMNRALKERVIRNTAHQKGSNVNPLLYQNVWTCPVCRRPLAYDDIGGNFHMTKYSYISKENRHHKTQVATEPDHHPPWRIRVAKLEKRKATRDEIREDYLDESQLRALCRICNGSHRYEGKKIKDYDSDDSTGDPGTPDDEPENKGRWSFFHDRRGGGGGAAMGGAGAVRVR